MKIAVIEDEQAHYNLLSSYIKKWGKENNIKLNVWHYVSAESFLFVWDSEKDFDVLFVDIQMSGMSGMDMARRIRQSDEKIVIIFTTGISDYIEEGYDVAAMHYLLKPIREEKVKECLNKALTRRDNKKYILVHTDEDIIKLPSDDINYIEAMGHGCIVGVKAGKNSSIIIKESISEMEKQVDENEYVKCHRSYICSIVNIHHIDKTSIYFDNGDSVPVSRRMYDKVNQAFIRYFKAKGMGNEI